MPQGFVGVERGVRIFRQIGDARAAWTKRKALLSHRLPQNSHTVPNRARRNLPTPDGGAPTLQLRDILTAQQCHPSILCCREWSNVHLSAGNNGLLGTPPKFFPHVWVRLQWLPVDSESGGRIHPLRSGGRADVPQRFHGTFPGTGMCSAS